MKMYKELCAALLCASCTFVIIFVLVQNSLREIEGSIIKENTSAGSKSSLSNHFQLTDKMILEIAPNANLSYVTAITQAFNEIKKAGINSPRRLAHFIAQIGFESHGFKRLDENMNYSASRLRAVFPSRVNSSKAKQLHRKPKEIANWVYGGRLGNRGQNTNDGWRYRGSGFIQLTGLSNFKEIGNLIHEDIVANPELARTPNVAIRAAIAYWIKHNFNTLADDNNLCAIRKRLNGGYGGVNETKQWARRALVVLDNDVTTKIDKDGVYVQSDIPELLNILAERGITYNYEGVGNAERLQEALLIYQRQNDIPETGIFDYQTLLEISHNHEADAVKDKC